MGALGQGTGVPLVNERLEREFPNLTSTGYTITSPETPEYNCIAWAAHDTERWWEPDPLGQYYWPAGVSLEITLDTFVRAFATRGFVLCERDQLEPGFEKIAFYVDRNGNPTHVARQLSNGKWTSKLGDWEDIEHKLDGLTDSSYGSVAKVLKRLLPT